MSPAPIIPEPTRAQEAQCEALALLYASVRVSPPTRRLGLVRVTCYDDRGLPAGHLTITTTGSLRRAREGGKDA